jgi:hypothetical protein
MIKQYDDGCHYCIVVMFGVGERGYFSMYEYGTYNIGGT